METSYHSVVNVHLQEETEQCIYDGLSVKSNLPKTMYCIHVAGIFSRGRCTS